MSSKAIRLDKKNTLLLVLLTLLSMLLVTHMALAGANNHLKHNTFTTPKPFMDLFYDFTGSTLPGYPKGKINASQSLLNVVKPHLSSPSEAGPLILFVNSSFYIYDASGKRQLAMQLRASQHTGFFPMTAISHIGPAIAYYAKVKEEGGTDWKAGLNQLLKDINAVRRLNQSTKDNWLDTLHEPIFMQHRKAIQNMVDYACAMSGNYISEVLKGKPFTEDRVYQDFYHHSAKRFPIPYNTVMVGTFMLTATETLDSIYRAVKGVSLNWSSARVLVRNVAGQNLTAGVSKESNWLVPLIINLSDGKLAENRVFIAPYAKVVPSLGKQKLPQKDLDYYRLTVWGTTYNRVSIAKRVFTAIPNIESDSLKSLPGNYDNTPPSDMLAFMKRLKYTLSEPTEMLSNSVAFWMVGEFAAKRGNLKKIIIPGLTMGFPKGIKAYPTHSPEIPL